MFKIIAVIVAVMCVHVTFAEAENNPALDSLINYVIQHNPEIEMSHSKLKASEYQYRAAGWLPDPTVSLALSNVPYSSLALDETPMSGVALGISQKIPWPGELAAKKAIAGYKAEAFTYRNQAVVNRIVRSVKSTYYDYSFWSLAEEILNKNRILLELLVDVTATKYANGDGMAADMLKAQTELTMIQDRRLEFEKMRKMALAKINSLAGAQSAYDFRLVPHLSEIDSIDLSLVGFKQSADKSNPALAVSRINTRIAAKRKSLTKSEYWPDFTLSFEYRIRDRSAMDPLNGEDFITAKIGLSLPIWFKHNQNNKLRSSTDELRAAEADYRNTSSQLEYSVSSVVYELERLDQSYKLYVESIIPNAEASLESADIAYRVGKLDFESLLNSQKMLFELELDKLKISRDYYSQLALLEELTGVSYGSK